MDLAKVGAVQSLCDEKMVNRALADGWVLLTVKIVDPGRHSDIWYVLGKPREKPLPPKRELTEEERDLLTHITDPRHPDHKLIRSIIGNPRAKPETRPESHWPPGCSNAKG